MQSRERDLSLVKIDYLLPVNVRGTQPVRMCFQDSEAALRNHGALPLSHIRLLLMNLNLKQKKAFSGYNIRELYLFSDSGPGV